MTTIEDRRAHQDTAEVRRARDQLAEAQRLARVGSWEWDVVANEVTWSDELFRIYGLAPGEVLPSYAGFLERVHPDDRESVDERNRKAFADRQPFEDVKRGRRPDGSEFLMRTKGEVFENAAGAVIRMVGVCEDVTAALEAEQAAAELAAIVESSSDAIAALSAEGEIRSWSPGAEQLYGYSATQAIGRSAIVLVPEQERAEEARRMARVLTGEPSGEYEARRVRRDGSFVDVSVAMSPLRDREGSVTGVAVIERDITERRAFEAQLRRLADDDPLTGIPNRRRFEDEVGRRVALDGHTEGAVLVLGLDNFKYVNETLGHGGGDELLRRVARTLRAHLDDADFLARLRGDEFGVVLAASAAKTSETLGDALLRALREADIKIAGHPVAVTASLGIAALDGDGASADELIARADRAMYAAKEAGRDCLFVAGPDASRPSPETPSWERRIREALADDGFVLHAQPILDLRTGVIAQHELLLRMREGDDLVPPGRFLGLAERLGLIHEIDGWVVSRAMEALAANPRLRLEVNLSAHSLDNRQLVEQIAAGLSHHRIDPSRLIFEITETAAIGNLDTARALARSLEGLGCSLALDDFGTGFGSFYYLKHLPVRYLKIDGEFVAGPRSRTDDLVIESIVRIARGLGIRTVAEFVEEQSTLEAMRDAGVDFAQGFHVGHPGPLADLL